MNYLRKKNEKSKKCDHVTVEFMIMFNSQEQIETHLRILCEFTVAVELLRFSYGCRTNIYKDQHF